MFGIFKKRKPDPIMIGEYHLSESSLDKDYVVVVDNIGQGVMVNKQELADELSKTLGRLFK